MLKLYIICSILGGIFMLLSVSGGLDLDADADLDFDSDSEVDDVDFGTHADPEQQRSNSDGRKRNKFWLPVFSFKFWTFGVGCFGLTGLALTLLVPQLGERAIALASLGTGAIAGTAIAWSLRALSANQTNSLTQPEDYVGTIGQVEIPFDRNTPGKVRLSIKNSTISHTAMTEDETKFQQGDEVLVVSYNNNRVWVVSADTLRGASTKED